MGSMLDAAIALRIIEHSDAATLEVLQEIPVFAQLMARYGKSTIKEILTRLVGKEPRQCLFIADSPSRICNNNCQQRLILPTISWDTVAVMERRAEIVGHLVHGASLLAPDNMTWPHLANANQLAALRLMVRQGIECCDHLADIEATVVGLLELAKPGVPTGLPRSLEHDIARRPQWLASYSEQENAQEHFVRWKTRGEQGRYLESLDTHKLVSIVVVLRIASEKLRAQNQAGRLNQPQSLMCGLYEVMMRHGSYFLVSWLVRTGTCGHRYSHANALRITATRDLFRDKVRGRLGPEFGQVEHRQLCAVLDQQLRQRLDIATGQHLETEALLAAQESILGRQMDGPADFIFRQDGSTAPSINESDWENSLLSISPSLD
ncbi:hypothetical protein CDD82_2521 [Ophiocordyceps australis]|uniref:Uncharacterized protein n=1 Tax=Ophiocordyceps australis TaxID=1399860 RepID=A0A2C5XV23_9HYPO|nr:hypothetical protein CDD82_2521 [Ophiocordyceps australis]